MFQKIKGYFLGLSIAKKMLLGYFPLSALTIITAGYALSSLERLNSINESIIHTDIKLIEATDKMIDTVLAQELYGMRYIILKSMEMKSVFFERDKEFQSQVESVATLPQWSDFSLDQLKSLHADYNSLFLRWFEEIENGPAKEKNGYENQIKKKQGELLIEVKKLNSRAHRNRDQKTVMTANIGTRAFKVVAVLCALSLLLGMGVAMSMTRYISGAINRLKIAARQISEGRFENLPEINNRDEIGELSFDFSNMASELKNLKEVHLATSPLTHLPGGVSIENYLETRLGLGSPFSFCYCDLDNFKVYSDKYGYARGSEVIKATGQLIEKVVAEYGSEGDFIGHIGGDDFVIITSPARHDNICRNIIEEFDQMIAGYYDKKDIKKGYIRGKTREGAEREFPLISISIAVVTNEKRDYKDHIQVGESAASLKDHVKSLPGSNYVVERRLRDSTRKET